MAKKTSKKQIKEIKEKPTKKIKEIISNKGDDMVKNPQTTDIEIEEKPPQKIELEIPKKEEENTEIVSEKPEPTISEEELTRVLKIPMQEAQTEETTNPVKEALFSSPESPEPEFEEEEEEKEDLNEKYFGDSSDDMSDDDIDGVFFEDEELMSEMAVEIIDLGMTTMAQAIAQDFDNPKKYAVSDYKKNKIKKPLRLLLQKRGVKVSPEIMFGVTLLVVYAPMMVLAVQERKAKRNAQQQQDIADEIPEHIPMVDAEQVRRQQNTPPPPPPPPIKKKGGRPKGSKDKKPRKTEGYKGNSNSK